MASSLTDSLVNLERGTETAPGRLELAVGGGKPMELRGPTPLRVMIRQEAVVVGSPGSPSPGRFGSRHLTRNLKRAAEGLKPGRVLLLQLGSDLFEAADGLRTVKPLTAVLADLGLDPHHRRVVASAQDLLHFFPDQIEVAQGALLE